MRIDDYVPGLFYGGGKYDALLPSPEMLSNAWQTGEDALAGESATWAQLALQDATRLMRSSMARVGAQVGVPSVFEPPFDQLVSAIIDPDPAEILEMSAGIAVTALDAAFEAMGAVPVVGFIGQGIGLAVKLALRRRQKDQPPPPFVRYEPATNETWTALLMEQVGPAQASAPDWTPIFRPPAVGPWTSREVQGWQRQWYVDGLNVGDPASFDGWGLLPGHARGSLSIYSTGLTPEETDYRAGGGHLPAGAEVIAPHLTWPERYELIGDRTWDTTQVLPSYLHAGMSAWQAMTAKSAAIFNVDVRGVGAEWRSYVEGGLEEFERWMATHDREDKSGEFWAGWAAKRGLYALPSFEEKMSSPGKPSASFWYDYPSRLRYDNIARARLSHLRRRQEKALDTLLVAYCSTKQAAFRDPKLRELLELRRGQLLEHAAVRDVVLDDVIDEDFRSSVATAQFSAPGGKLAATPGAKKKPGGDWPGPDGVPAAEPWGDPAGAGGVGLLLVGGLAAAAVLS